MGGAAAAKGAKSAGTGTAGGTQQCSGPGCDKEISDEGLDFIAEHESFEPQLYNDPVGHCTVGYGHLVHHGGCGPNSGGFAGGLTQQQGVDLLRSDAKIASDAVNRYVKVPLNQAQHDALTSFTFNSGAGALRDSTLLRELNAGNYNAVPGQLNRWVHGDGRKLPGLVTRRAQEGRLFTGGSYK